uniref:Death domain-containing protein n=1 Tax=Triatoma dimidiata TaxID=72491 RepID=A0A0V0GAD2_TRIDM
METDAVPEPPRYSKTPRKEKENDKSNIKNNATEDNPKPSYQAVQNIYGNVHNFKDCHGMIQIGHTINIKGSKSKKKTSKSNPTKEKSSINTKLAEPPSHVAAVMTQCLDVLTFKDIEIIRNMIVNTTWHELAKSIKAHASHVKDGLPQAEAVEKVLCSWIEEHSHSALVAILVQFLWQIREVEAASLLARIHCTKLK